MSELNVEAPEELLARAGYPVEAPPQAYGLYVSAVVAGDLVITSGAIPVKDGQVTVTGRVGGDVGLEQAQEAARLCVANALAGVRAEVGSLRRVRRIVKLTGYVCSAPGFTQQPQVLNAASQLLLDVFGEGGRCARTAVGVAELPFGCPVELELILLLR